MGSTGASRTDRSQSAAPAACFRAPPPFAIVYAVPEFIGPITKPKTGGQPMHTATIHSGLIGLALTAFLGASSVAVAETITYKAVLNAQSQPTPNDSKGTGTAEVTYDT